MAQCPKCGAEYADGAQFCRNCGEALPQQEYYDDFAAQNAAPQYDAQPQTDPQPQYQPQYDAQPQYQAPAPQYDAQPQYQAAAPQYQAPQPVYQTPVSVNVQTVERDKPGMPWGSFFWSRVLFAIPLIGFIFMMIWACGGSSNKTRVQFARSYLFPGLIIGALIGIAFILLLVLGSGGDLERFWRELLRSLDRLF